MYLELGKASNRYLYLYFGLTLVLAVLTFSGNLLLSTFALTSSKSIHERMLVSLLRTKMSFFETTPQGRILNRLSKDTDALDSNLLRFVSGAVATFFMLMGMCISISTVNWPALLVIIPCVIIFLLIYSLFKKVFSQVKRIESISRSPVYNISSETMESLITIRAYNEQEQMLSLFREASDYSCSAFFITQGVMRWMVFRLGLMSACFAILITFLAIVISPYSQEVANYTGVICSYGYYISYILNDFVMTLVQFEGEMSSVVRVMEYVDLPAEGVMERPVEQRLRNWPALNCEIKIQNLTFRYRPEL